jgi:hypothetical protein
VLKQLPESLAIAVLASSLASLYHQTSRLPESLNPLAIEAAYPSIRRNQSLKFKFRSARERDIYTGCLVLHGAIKATSAMKEVVLEHIPVGYSEDRLLAFISRACKSASHVSLDYYSPEDDCVLGLQHVAQLGAALSRNALTSLQFSLSGQPGQGFNLDCLVKTLAGLQSLSLSCYPLHRLNSPLPFPRCITNQLRLTQLRLGPGINLAELPAMLPQITNASRPSALWL